jgi:hypothetical protein
MATHGVEPAEVDCGARNLHAPLRMHAAHARERFKPGWEPAVRCCVDRYERHPDHPELNWPDAPLRPRVDRVDGALEAAGEEVVHGLAADRAAAT